MPFNRPGPSSSAAETDPGTIQKGNNGAYWIVLETAKKVRRWVPLSPTRPRVFHPFYNGDTFRVIVGDPRIRVFKDTHLVYTLDSYTRVWGLKYTVLVEKKPGVYLYMSGVRVVELKTDGPVLGFKAPMGNSWVADAYAWTEERCYLLLEGTSIPHPGKKGDDPYPVYYTHKMKGTPYPMKVHYDAWKK
jgi:hypothetical protein